ncbi:glycosyltransferase [Nocardiopsis tropica]
MAHIVMVGIPAMGHIMPSLEVIRELVDRGHRVSYVNDSRMAEPIVGAGADLIDYGSLIPGDEAKLPEGPLGAMNVFLDDAIHMLPQLRAAFDADPPDLLLFDSAAFAGRVYAASRGLPAVMMASSTIAWDGYHEEVGAAMRALPGADEWHERFAAWLRAEGHDSGAPTDFAGASDRAIAALTRAMQPHLDRVDQERVTFVGPCFATTRTADEPVEVPDGDRLLLVSLGSTFTRRPDFYRSCIAAFGDLPGWHTIIQIGPFVDPADLGAVPDSVEIRSWVPQRAVLRRADAFITHAGMGGCSEALINGVPMIAVPQAADQFQNADRLVELGVGRRLGTAVATPAALRTALLVLVADDAVAERVREWQRDTAELGGTDRAADLIEGILRDRSAATADTAAG